jgi:hypothetical protein
MNSRQSYVQYRQTLYCEASNDCATLHNILNVLQITLINRNPTLTLSSLSEGHPVSLTLNICLIMFRTELGTLDTSSLPPIT